MVIVNNGADPASIKRGLQCLWYENIATEHRNHNHLVGLVVLMFKQMAGRESHRVRLSIVTMINLMVPRYYTDRSLRKHLEF